MIELVKPSVDYVRHKKFKSGNYPSSLSNETDRLVHWCHGAPGVIHMLIQSYKVCIFKGFLRNFLTWDMLLSLSDSIRVAGNKMKRDMTFFF